MSEVQRLYWCLEWKSLISLKKNYAHIIYVLLSLLIWNSKLEIYLFVYF